MSMYYKSEKDKIYLSINKGEYLNESLLRICTDNALQFAWINGIGAILDPEVGYYDVENKNYIKKTFLGDFELVSLIGNLTYKDDVPFIHTHISFSGTDFKVYGGHLFDCKIAAAGEFILFIGKNRLQRTYNDGIGLSLWNCEI